MANTDDNGAGAPSSQPDWTKAAKRYGPIAAVVALVIGAIAVFGGGGGDDGDDGPTDAATSGDELILSGPMTPQRAELEGEDPDFGPNCDTDTGRIKLVSIYAPPCVVPFEGDNGGATYAGVTEDEIKVVYYASDPALDPLTAATISSAGANVNPETAAETVAGFVGLYNALFETYGRTVVVEAYTGTGAGDDVEAARADAIAIAEMEPFAVIGGPQQASPVFASELASKGIVCGPSCATALPEEIVEEYEPYIWQAGPTPDQAASLAAEAIGALAAPGPAALAGDPALHDQDRVYALLHYDTPDGDHEGVFQSLKASLADNGIDLETDIEFTLDLARGQENARTNITRLKEAGVTTIIYYGDPLTPGALTQEATAQNYSPEWILGPNLLMDTAIFARLLDGDQWQHGFGIALTPARTDRAESDAWRIWDWAFGGEPPNNTVAVLEPPLRTIFNGIHLAGPDLNPETFRDAQFRYPITGGVPTAVQVSRGDHGVWPELDWGGSDDLGIIWWDPEAEGPDEVGNDGIGLYRYANGGQRYTIGNMPSSPEEAGLFDVDSSVTIYEELPEGDRAPDYDPPEGFGP